uniref:Tubulin-specific chaperone E n=1 Tax=Monopterus albus TaxID=43700 RepID=A0A3Q3J3P7_MONAL
MGVDQTEPEVPANALGRRVSCGGERATVRYVGPVPPTAGLWLGLEWDNPERGKHDGSHEGVRYFTCRHPKGASFVRPAKVSFGVDYLTAVQQAYEINTEEVLSEEISISSKKLEWEGIKELAVSDIMKQSLPTALLSRSEVNGAGAEGEIRKTTPNIQWLDLSRTLLSCWEDLAAIAQQLDHLKGIQLNYNRLCLPSDPSAHCQAFSSLRVLALNGCDLTWPQILECAPMWPQLEELCAEENNITELQRLEQLNLSSTGLSVIRFDDAAPGSQTAMFPALKNLSLDHNNISEWCVVDELAKLPSLVQFSCRGNRLVSSDGNLKTANQMLIAKLGKLVILNSCKIQPEDRRGAELDYIKMFGEQWLKAGGQSQSSTEFNCQHPRYQSLIDKYGAIEEGELKKPEPFALKNQLLKITFVFPDDADRKPIEKKLPASMLVQKVKGLLYRLLKVPATDLRLTYTILAYLCARFEITGDLKSLQFYSIEDGDRVLVRWA